MFPQIWIVFFSFSSVAFLQIVSYQQADQQVPAAQPPRMPAQAKSPVWLNNAPADLAAQVNQLINDKTKSQNDVQNGINSLLANVPEIAAKYNAAKEAHQNNTGAMEKIKAIFENNPTMSIEQMEEQATTLFKTLSEADQNYVASMTQCNKNAGEMAALSGGSRQKRQYYGYGCGCYYCWCGCYYCYYCQSCYGGYYYYG